MHACYAIFRIEFYKGDGSADADAAKRAYDWCKENYGWFSEDVFLLEKNKFVQNWDEHPDGLVIRDGYGAEDEIPDNVSWLQKPFKATKGERLVASIRSEACVAEAARGEEYFYDERAWGYGISGSVYVHENFRNYGGYAAREDGGELFEIGTKWEYRPYQGLFKNAKTGEEILCGETSSKDMTLKIGGKTFPVEDCGDSVCVSDSADEAEIVGAFVSALKNAEDYEGTEAADWTFEGLYSQKSNFTLCGSNPAEAAYSELKISSSGNVYYTKGKSVPPAEEAGASADSGKTVELDFDEDGNLPDDFDEDSLSDATTIVVRGMNTLPAYYEWLELARMKNLKSVILEEGVEEIHYDAFGACEFKSVRLPKSLKVIEDKAFRYCFSLKEITYAGTVEEWNAVEVQEAAWVANGGESNADSVPCEMIPADVIKCSDGEVKIDKSLEGDWF